MYFPIQFCLSASFYLSPFLFLLSIPPKAGERGTGDEVED
jgi:hypothetical protein